MNVIIKIFKKIINNKKMILAFIFLIVFLQKCTVINITSSSLFKKKAYNNYTYLHEGVKNDHSEIVKISKYPYNSIMYDDKENYFIIYGDYDIRKINSKGVEEFFISSTGDVSYANSGWFVFTKNMVYDLSKTPVTKTKINNIIHASGEQLELDGFLNLLNQYYQKAHTVIYAEETSADKNHKVYLKTENEWMGIYISKLESSGVNFYHDGEILQKFPEKFQRLIYLKNPVNNVYSSRSSGSETFSSYPDVLRLTKEEDMEYPDNKKIDISFYQKEETLGVIAYTSIPTSFKGTAYFNLKIGDQRYRFKEMGSNRIGLFSKVNHDLSYYSLPKQYLKKSEVSFLKVFSPSSKLKTKSEGLYVVRPINIQKPEKSNQIN
ncbi:hypothetical protein F6U93_13660 [Tamlana haliotis]|uniref:Uncharacterized protein n=1 Tax=Pseudotamlana haliotis TaxID=2614804 RepID=A0A6N6MBJ9_9FLAO|nr:hypothetical protein [Tamlana haliotis]KAB1066895.1 hypothetical protein F6U93_13660 [Tamlana haliotis]